jgi:hypothetical protein
MIENKDFQIVDDFCADVVKNKRRVVGIMKTTRVGVTTGVINQCILQGKPLIVLLPTLKLCNEKCLFFRNKYPDKTIEMLRDNSTICTVLRQELSENESLREFPYQPRKCNGCNEDCEYRRIIDSKPDVLFMTPQKFSHIHHSNDVKSLDGKLELLLREHFKVIFLDEVMYLLANFQKTLSINTEMLNQWYSYCLRYDTEMDIKLAEHIIQLRKEIHLFSSNAEICKNVSSFIPDSSSDIYKYLRLLRNRYQEGDMQTSSLANFYLMIIHSNLSLYKKNNHISLVGINYLDVLVRAAYYFGDKLMILCDAGFPRVTFNRQTTEIDFGQYLDKPYQVLTVPNEGDPLDTNSMLLVVVNNRKVTVTNFWKDKENQLQAKAFIDAIKRQFPNNSLTLAPNKRIKELLNTDWYYRDDKSRGIDIPSGCKILGFLLSPTLPPKSLMPLAYKLKGFVIKNGNALRIPSNIEEHLRSFEEISTFINSSTRQKSPDGSYKSITFLFGITLEQVKKFYTTSGIKAPSIIQVTSSLKQSNLFEIFHYIEKLWLSEEWSRDTVNDLSFIALILLKLENMVQDDENITFNSLRRKINHNMTVFEATKLKNAIRKYRYIIDRSIGANITDLLLINSKV